MNPYKKEGTGDYSSEALANGEARAGCSHSQRELFHEHD